MPCHFKDPEDPSFVLVICEKCHCLFVEVESEFRSRTKADQYKPLCIHCDPEAEEESVTLTAKGEAEIK